MVIAINMKSPIIMKVIEVMSHESLKKQSNLTCPHALFLQTLFFCNQVIKEVLTTWTLGHHKNYSGPLVAS